MQMQKSIIFKVKKLNRGIVPDTKNYTVFVSQQDQGSNGEFLPVL